MIKKVGEQIQMEFGVGNIHIESGWFIPENGVNKLGLVTSENHDKPMPIGRNNNNLSKEVELWKYPIQRNIEAIENKVPPLGGSGGKKLNMIRDCRGEPPTPLMRGIYE